MNRIIGLMKKYNVSPIKSLGQNFLIDENIIEKLARAISPKPGDYIIEIGPGLGSLTERLVGKSAVLYCIEIDKRLHQIILERFGSFPGFYAGNFDVLKFNFEDPLPGYEQGYKIKVTGNLPYYITTPIIMKFLESDFDFDSMYFMMQKEVADRIMAKPSTKDYGALTVAVNHYCQVRPLVSVPPHCFSPQPNVHSAFLEFKKRSAPAYYVKNKDFFFQIVRGAFNQRRKNIINALYNYPGLHLEKEDIQKAVESMGLRPDIRGENLDADRFAELSNLLYKE
jgi:16S rRNA (adenine1518-N6/adenine1519-N6)-dimethyltransferase